jgi:ubiquitin C-terminal hydrolase
MTDHPSLGGIVNLGMTCYANAVIQCMRHCDKIQWLFEEGHYNNLLKGNEKQTLMTKSFAEIVQLLTTCKQGQSVRPADFLMKFRNAIRGTGFEHMSSLRPHDSYEFYLCLLDTLHEALSQEVDMKISKEVLTHKDTRLATALNVWKNEFSKKYSPFVEYSYGLLYFVVQCHACKNETYRWEPMTALKAVVSSGRQGQTLEEMLMAEFLPETFDDYVCEHCSPVRQTATRKTYIWKLPKYVVVVLKRFTFDGGRINTPLQLASTTFSFHDMFSKISPEYDPAAVYNLISIVDHHGAAQGGHYTAQCKTKGAWHIYDDESNHSIEKPIIGSSTYMLWFG